MGEAQKQKKTGNVLKHVPGGRAIFLFFKKVLKCPKTEKISRIFVAATLIMGHIEKRTQIYLKAEQTSQL